MKFAKIQPRILIIIFFGLAIAYNQPVLADTIKDNSVDTIKQAAQEVVKDKGIKKQFGKSENGDRLLNQAQQKANNNLNQLAKDIESQTELPDSKKLFLDNLKGKN